MSENNILLRKRSMPVPANHESHSDAIGLLQPFALHLERPCLSSYDGKPKLLQALGIVQINLSTGQFKIGRQTN
jgi:hypothetical protein